MLASRPTQTRYVVDWTPVRHTASFLATTVDFRILPPPGMSRTALARALGSAVARLRTASTAFTPPRFWRRPAADRIRAAVTAGVMAGCRQVRDATSGYFDPWAMPGGFDPAGLLTGWALERAAVTLADAGLTDFALTAGDELLVRGGAGGGNAWLVGIRHP
ncbi:MAG: FAD:protein FMN transferase, partial [Micromonosporaceae bacterium]